MESSIKGNENLVLQINGLSYTDVKEICTELISAEIDKYKNEAKEIAKQREETLTQKLLTILEEKRVQNEEAIEELKNPDMQYCFREAQIAYMRYGTTELENVLSNILADRLLERDRTTLQIALSEAIKTAPLLLPEHLDILSMVFIFRYTKFLNVNSIPSFVNRFTPFVNYFTNSLKNISKDEIYSMCSHIEYAKCGINQISSLNILDTIKDEYPGLFMKGYTEQEIEKQFEGNEVPKIFIKHIQNQELFQINALNTNTLEQMISEYDEGVKSKIKSMFKSNQLNTTEVEKMITEKIPEFNTLLEIWNNGINRVTLTSVGTVLGRMNLKKFTNENFDMKVWISR